MENKVATLMAVLCALACVNFANAMLIVPNEAVGLYATRHSCLASKFAINNFEANKMAGHWYEVSSNNGWESSVKCRQVLFTPNNGDFALDFVYFDTLHDRRQYSEAVAKSDSYSNEGKFNVTHSPDPELDRADYLGEPLWVLDTDYNNYAVTYGCITYNGKDIDFISVLSRTPQLEGKYYDIMIKDALLSNLLDPNQMKRSVQDCGALLH